MMLGVTNCAIDRSVKEELERQLKNFLHPNGQAGPPRSAFRPHNSPNSAKPLFSDACMGLRLVRLRAWALVPRNVE